MKSNSLRQVLSKEENLQKREKNGPIVVINVKQRQHAAVSWLLSSI
jgi:hypothetical protein